MGRGSLYIYITKIKIIKVYKIVHCAFTRINKDRNTIAVMNSLHAPLRKDAFELPPTPLPPPICLPDN